MFSFAVRQSLNCTFNDSCVSVVWKKVPFFGRYLEDYAEMRLLINLLLLVVEDTVDLKTIQNKRTKKGGKK